MTTTTKAKSRIVEAVHEGARDLHRLGFIDKRPSGPSQKLLDILERKRLEAVLRFAYRRLSPPTPAALLFN